MKLFKNNRWLLIPILSSLLLLVLMMRICTRILFIRDGEIVKDLSGGQKEKIVRLLRGEE